MHSFSWGVGVVGSCHPCVQRGADTAFSRSFVTAYSRRCYTDVHVNPESGAIVPCL